MRQTLALRQPSADAERMTLDADGARGRQLSLQTLLSAGGATVAGEVYLWADLLAGYERGRFPGVFGAVWFGAMVVALVLLPVYTAGHLVDHAHKLAEKAREVGKRLRAADGHPSLRVPAVAPEATASEPTRRPWWMSCLLFGAGYVLLSLVLEYC